MMGLGFGFIWMLLFWVGVVVLAIWLVGVLFPSIGHQTNNDNGGLPSAQAILKARYANGELTTEEYYDMLHTIQQEQIQ